MRGASAVLIVDGRFALQLRDHHAPTAPNQWGLFGGGIEPGESSYQAVVREIQEELELDVRGADHLADFGLVRVYLKDVTEQWPDHVLHEGREARLFHFEEVKVLGLNRTTRAALAEAAMVAL
jgi:8-oxo-dGTP pyrophosphatase MutT (NUDIX family)